MGSEFLIILEIKARLRKFTNFAQILLTLCVPTLYVGLEK